MRNSTAKSVRTQIQFTAADDQFESRTSENQFRLGAVAAFEVKGRQNDGKLRIFRVFAPGNNKADLGGLNRKAAFFELRQTGLESF